MFDRIFKRRKHNIPIDNMPEAPDGYSIIEIFLDPAIYEKLLNQAKTDEVSVNCALQKALEQGIRNSDKYTMLSIEEDFEAVKKALKQYMQDNETLNKLVAQNDYYENILRT